MFDFKKVSSRPTPVLGGLAKDAIYPARVIKSMMDPTSQPEVFKNLGEYHLQLF